MWRTNSSETDVSNLLVLFHLSVGQSLWNSFPADHCGVLKSPDGVVEKKKKKCKLDQSGQSDITLFTNMH